MGTAALRKRRAASFPVNLVPPVLFVYDSFMGYVIAAILLLVFFGWNEFLPGYRDRNTEPIEPQPDQVFDPRCLSIVLEHAPPSEKAVIMVHGYPSTPYAFRYAADRAYQAGYDVFVPLLPGFGTKPEDLYGTTFTQWYGYVQRFYRDKRASYPSLFVIGTSMGGAMTLRLGEEFSGTGEAPDALATVAAPVFFNDPRHLFIQKWGYAIMRTVALFTPAIKPGIQYGGQKSNDGEELWIGYSGAFVRGGVSFMHALKGIRRNLPLITVPMLSMHDVEDRTISYRNLKEIESGVSSKSFVARTVRMTSAHNRHVLLMYPSVQEQLMNEILEFFDRNGQNGTRKEAT